MNIGEKLHKARTDSKLTQEQVAQSLGVSRQSISNWENERTYPDIISVVKLSDLYSVSLDYLLKDKEEVKVTSYIDYLEESTNVVKSKQRLSKIILSSAYLLIWAFSIIMFWFFTDGSDAMGYSLMHLWIIQPISIFVVSIIIGINNFGGPYKWIFTAIAGVMYMLSEYATFSLANTASFGNINTPNWGMVVAGMVISAIAMGIGVLINKIKSNKKS